MEDSKSIREQAEFEQIIEQIGNAGPFQKRFALAFVSLLTFLTGMQYMYKIISLAVPDHWCYVPGREDTNYTLEEWKKITIPIEVNTNETHSYSKCTRFASILQGNNEIIKCDNGWEYDCTWYDSTASMQNDWVCDNSMVPNNVLVINRAAEVIGTIVLGQLADNYGRMPIFFISLSTIISGRIISLFISSWVYLFLFFSLIGSLSCSSVFHSPFIIAMEISGGKYRASISMLLSYGWALGITISPLFMWWQRDWIAYCLITTLPIGIFFFCQKWMIESPRWLASRGKNKRCIKVLNKIAQLNKTKIPENIETRLMKAKKEENNAKIYSILSVFSSTRFAKNIIILVYSIFTSIFIYMCLIISANHLSGNPYLNYLYLGMVDLPVFTINKYGCDRYGRRLMSLVSLLLMSLGCITMLFVVQDSSKSLRMTIAFMFTKGSASMAFATLNLQVIEICPTCIRQTSASFVAIITNILCILGPYVVALGISVNIMIPYFVYATCAILALVSCLFLPETLGHQLPDTIDDAATFGANQDFWGRTKPRVTTPPNEAEIPLNVLNDYS